MKKRWSIIVGILVAVVVIITLASYFAEEPVRRYVQEELNARLKGYSVRITKLNFRPFTLSVDLERVILIQKANPEPAIADIEKIHASVRWLELLTGHLAGEAKIENPKFYINPANLKREIKKPPEEKEAWQDTIEALSPVTVNAFQVENGEVTYIEHQQAVTVSGLKIVARNVSNVRSGERVYPSDFLIQAVLFGTGKITIDGQADFLLKPFMAVKADISVEGMDLAPLGQIAEFRQVSIRKGVLSAAGTIEVSPQNMIFILKNLALTGAEMDYIHTATAAPRKKPERAKQEAKEKAKELVDKPGLLIKANRIMIVEGNFGIINRTASPDYRIYMDELQAELRNFSNKFSQGPAELYLKGQFMGSGETVVSAAFRPEKKGPDFNVRLAIKGTEMTAMNKIFRAYGNFDVEQGLFSLYSEVMVKNNRITGYIKPLFRDMKVYDRRTDKEKSEFRKLYEKIVGGILELFENPPREQVATEIPLSGTIANPEASTWEVIENLVQNAFFQAILPGFEKNIK